ncbi:MASE1 domain-containing protein [Sinorhizobium garamanticum]|uniref:histidine kinase n=1 Tax=Sinorhizobium garamanticum TaxID=680247 RepID=A0ABY8DI45_9HYPH|nr:MASE1 domain-containing protein [Sinorhizobium garamanticum]WEX90564.1 MASE1 domain-containing protein [Sinorhizobium garamanticum]
MMSVWLHRPRFLHLALFVAAYVLGCAFAHVLGIVPGTSIAIWTPGGLFMATLMLAATPSWPWWVLAGCVGELIGQFLWFHSPLPASLLMYVGNALEAMAGAWLVTRTCGRPVRLETLKEVLAFVVLGAGIAPAISATVGSATLAWFDIKSQTFTAAWPLWWIGDATGVLIVAPLALDVFHNWHGNSQLSAARWIEASVLGLIFLGVAALSLSGYLPFAYIIMPPLLWAAVRFELRGAAITLIVLALITTVFTISGAGQFAGDPESQRQRQIMLQLFLAISALSALIVAAISRQHQLAVLRLSQSERSLRELVETLPALIWCAAPDGKPIYFSQQLSGFIGFNVEDKDVAGTSRLASVLNAIIHPDDLAAVKKLLAHSLATGEPYAQKHRLRRFDGEYRWVEMRAAAMRSGDGAIVQWNGVCLDIEDQVRGRDELRLAQENLARASQAASLAELSASIAHEVNQPLAAIVANSYACQRWLMAEPPNIERAQKRAERIIQDANSAADVVSRIRALFKHSVETRTSTTLSSVIAEARDLMAEEAARRRVRMEVDVESNLPFVALDRVQIQQVLINLIRNGMDAMDSTVGDRVFGIRVRRMGDVVQTEISDRGPGVASPDRIFEPFFTTKEHGMGMGLAICRSIVESHGGQLWAENNEPHGATFIFTLPVDAAAEATVSRAAGNQSHAL